MYSLKYCNVSSPSHQDQKRLPNFWKTRRNQTYGDSDHVAKRTIPARGSLFILLTKFVILRIRFRGAVLINQPHKRTQIIYTLG